MQNAAYYQVSFTYKSVEHESSTSYSPIHLRRLVLFALELLEECTVLSTTMSEIWHLQMNRDLHAEFRKLIPNQLMFVCRHWIELFCAADCLDSDVLNALSPFIPILRCWIMTMWIMGEVEQAGRSLEVFHGWLVCHRLYRKAETCSSCSQGSKIEDDGAKHLLKQLYCQLNGALAVSILSSGHPFVPLIGGPPHAFTRDAVSRIAAEWMDASQPWRSEVLRRHSDRARDMLLHQGVREDVFYVAFSSGVLTSISGQRMCRWNTASGSCTQNHLDGHVYRRTAVGSMGPMLMLQRGSLNGVTKSYTSRV